MKNYRRLLICLVILFSGIAFAPALAFPWTEKVNWQQYSMIYQTPTIFYVNSTADEFDVNVGDRVCATAAGVCTLRAAIQEASVIYNDVKDVTVEVPAGVYTLSKRSSPDRPYHISVERYSAYNLVIHGQGPDKTIIQSNGTAGVFSVAYSSVFSGVTIQNGNSGQRPSAYYYYKPWAGGISSWPGSEVTVLNSVIRNNQGDYGGGIGVDISTYLTIIDSTIQGNQAYSNGGGIYLYRVNRSIIRSSTIRNNAAINGGGGGIFTSSWSGLAGTDITLINSTISTNEANSGGGIYAYYTPFAIFNSTITNNAARGNSVAGGLYFDHERGPNFNIANTILAGNHSSTSPDCYTNGESRLNSQGYNLIGSTTACDFTIAAGDLIGRSAVLAPLSMNGGKTATHALLFDSPAIDAGNPAGCLDARGQPLTEDQRGSKRPLDGNGDGKSVCDIGAYETPQLYGIFLPSVRR
jgi:CSLREA domain-containing protein